MTKHKTDPIQWLLALSTMAGILFCGIGAYFSWQNYQYEQNIVDNGTFAMAEIVSKSYDIESQRECFSGCSSGVKVYHYILDRNYYLELKIPVDGTISGLTDTENALTFSFNDYNNTDSQFTETATKQASSFINSKLYVPETFYQSASQGHGVYVKHIVSNPNMIELVDKQGNLKYPSKSLWLMIFFIGLALLTLKVVVFGKNGIFSYLKSQ